MKKSILFLLFVCTKTIIMAQNLGLSYENRFALIIGNSKYSTGELKTPENDADKIADKLQHSGFNIEIIKNATLSQTKQAILDYVKIVGTEKNSVGLFYYSGYALQLNGINYLVPVDAAIKKADDLKKFALNLDELLSSFSKSGNSLNIITLDACRNNPFYKPNENQLGLAAINSYPNQYLILAAAPGKETVENKEYTSLFADEFYKMVELPSISLEKACNQMMKKIVEKSQKQQLIWTSSSFSNDFYFEKISSFTDSRDGKIYKTAKIGNQTWMAENLCYKGNLVYWDYGKDSVSNNLYGIFYPWESAQLACPQGWHVPTDNEWTSLVDFLGGEVKAGKILNRYIDEDTTLNNTNITSRTAIFDYGFSILYGGLTCANCEPDVVGSTGNYWSATPSERWNSIWIRKFYCPKTIERKEWPKDAGLHVRCLKDN